MMCCPFVYIDPIHIQDKRITQDVYTMVVGNLRAILEFCLPHLGSEVGKWFAKKYEETIGHDGNIQYFDCGAGLMDIYTSFKIHKLCIR